jgi:hypothetical protein
MWLLIKQPTENKDITCRPSDEDRTVFLPYEKFEPVVVKANDLTVVKMHLDTTRNTRNSHAAGQVLVQLRDFPNREEYFFTICLMLMIVTPDETFTPEETRDPPTMPLSEITLYKSEAAWRTRILTTSKPFKIFQRSSSSIFR